MQSPVNTKSNPSEDTQLAFVSQDIRIKHTLNHKVQTVKRVSYSSTEATKEKAASNLKPSTLDYNPSNQAAQPTRLHLPHLHPVRQYPHSINLPRKPHQSLYHYFHILLLFQYILHPS